MKNNLLGKKFLSCSFYLYRFRKYISYGFPIINFCNPGVHYEMPCMFSLQALLRNKGPPPLLSRPQLCSWVMISTSYCNISSQKDSYFLGHSGILYLWSPIIPGFCCKRYWLLIIRWRRGLFGKSFVSKHNSICKYCSHSSDNSSQQLETK